MIQYDGINLEGFEATSPSEGRDGTCRLLCLHTTALGFGTYHKMMRQYLAKDNEINAWMVEIIPALWQKVIGKSISFLPRGMDLHAYRHLLLWRFVINHWFRKRISLKCFDAIHIMTEGAAYSLVDIPTDVRIFKAVNIDATAKQFLTEYGYNPMMFSPMIRAQKKIYDAADLIVARNHWALRSLHDDYQMPESKTLMARNSLKCPEVSRQDYPPRQSGELVRFVFVGNDFDRKGGPELLKLHQEKFTHQIEMHIFSKRATPDHSLKNVVWHGFTPREKMISEMLPQMDVFIMPTFEDMHPWALIEAASLGLPIISTRMAGIPDIVLHGHTGLLCGKKAWDEVGEAMSLLATDEDKRQTMGSAARDHIKRNFDPDDQFGGLVQKLKMCL